MNIIKKNCHHSPILMLATSALLLVLGGMGMIVACQDMWSLKNPELPDVIPASSQVNLKYNELLSTNISTSLSLVDNFMVVKSVHAVSRELPNGRQYFVEFTLRNGNKFISFASLNLIDINKYPKEFKAERLNNDQLYFYISTDGTEYNAVPDKFFFDRFSWILSNSIQKISNPEWSKSVWESSNQLIRESRRDYARDQIKPLD